MLANLVTSLPNRATIDEATSSQEQEGLGKGVLRTWTVIGILLPITTFCFQRSRGIMQAWGSVMFNLIGAGIFLTLGWLCRYWRKCMGTMQSCPAIRNNLPPTVLPRNAAEDEDAMSVDTDVSVPMTAEEAASKATLDSVVELRHELSRAWNLPGAAGAAKNQPEPELMHRAVLNLERLFRHMSAQVIRQSNITDTLSDIMLSRGKQAVEREHNLRDRIRHVLSQCFDKLDWDSDDAQAETEVEDEEKADRCSRESSVASTLEVIIGSPLPGSSMPSKIEVRRNHSWGEKTEMTYGQMQPMPTVVEEQVHDGIY
ncbi:MAG: hypothetical protein M1820_001156 [Bogoriella megaspora]|nr:MAG: hypothetical protein M1820_001156 [Bogoriella megaspora]